MSNGLNAIINPTTAARPGGCIPGMPKPGRPRQNHAIEGRPDFGVGGPAPTIPPGAPAGRMYPFAQPMGGDTFSSGAAAVRKARLALGAEG